MKLPEKSCREEHLFLILPRDHNEGYIIPPQLFSPVKGTLNRRRISESQFCKARLQTSTNGPALHARGFTQSPTIDFYNCQSDYSIQIEGYNFTVWNRTSKDECSKYKNDTKKQENSFRKNS